jgi:hypothetical protein
MKTKNTTKWQKIADEYVALKRQLFPLNARLGQLASLLKDESPVDSILREGNYVLTIHDDSRTMVSQDTIVAELGEPWFNKHAKTTNFRVIRVSDNRE